MAIQDINPLVPVGSDPVSGGDEEFRLLKTDILQSLPGMTGPWVAPGEDCHFQDGEFRTVTIQDQILESPQVAIAVFSYDGSDGSLHGPGYGVVGGIRTATGAFEFTLTDNIASNLEAVCAGSANVGFAALNLFAARHATEANVIVVTNNQLGNGAAADPDNGYVMVFDAERT